MEKLNDILKAVIGILLIITFVAFFSSCDRERTEANNTGEIFTDTNEDDMETRPTSWKEKLKEESRELEAELNTLGEKAKEKGGELGREIEEGLSQLNEERKEILNDSTDENIEKRWEEFKVKARRELDSLDKRI